MVRFYSIYAVVFGVILAAMAPAGHAKSKAEAREAYCAKISVASEREICRDKDLTRRDGALNEVYRELRKKLSKRDFKDLRVEQRRWLVERNGCGSRTACLATKYEDRVAVLEQMLESLEHPNKSHVEIGCDGPGQRYVNGACVTTSGAADGDMTWQASSYNDPANKGRYSALLRFGVPETDDVAFQAICVAGSSGTFATTIMAYNSGDLSEGSNVAVTVSSDGYRQKLAGEIYSGDVEEGVAGLLLRPDFGHPFWNALAGGGSLSYTVKGLTKASLSLKGSGPAVRKFIGDCKAMSVAGAGATGGPVLSAKNRTCEQFGSIKSKNSKTPVTVTFVNKTDGHRAVMWIDFKGTPVDYAALDAGQSYTVNTYVTHPWMFTDGPGNCIEMYMPQAGQTVFHITAASPAFGPEND